MPSRHRYLLFGIELTDEQAATIALWGGSGYAGYFVFPRLIHRIAFNLLLKKVKQLRMDSLAIFSAHNLRPLASEINECGAVAFDPTATSGGVLPSALCPSLPTPPSARLPSACPLPSARPSHYHPLLS